MLPFQTQHIGLNDKYIKLNVIFTINENYDNRKEYLKIRLVS